MTERLSNTLVEQAADAHQSLSERGEKDSLTNASYSLEDVTIETVVVEDLLEAIAEDGSLFQKLRNIEEMKGKAQEAIAELRLKIEVLTIEDQRRKTELEVLENDMREIDEIDEDTDDEELLSLVHDRHEILTPQITSNRKRGFAIRRERVGLKKSEQRVMEDLETIVTVESQLRISETKIKAALGALAVATQTVKSLPNIAELPDVKPNILQLVDEKVQDSEESQPRATMPEPAFPPSTYEPPQYEVRTSPLQSEIPHAPLDLFTKEKPSSRKLKLRNK